MSKVSCEAADKRLWRGFANDAAEMLQISHTCVNVFYLQLSCHM